MPELEARLKELIVETLALEDVDPRDQPVPVEFAFFNFVVGGQEGAQLIQLVLSHR